MAAVDFGVLDSLRNAGYTQHGVEQLAAALAAGLPAPSPADANNHVGTYAPNTTPGALAPAPGPTSVDKSAKAYLQTTLNQWGLGSLADQAWSQYTGGADPTQVINDLRNTDAYRARFPAMKDLTARGEAISESQYIAYESELKTTAQAAGLPPGFYDQPADFSAFIANGVSAQEYKDRINQGFTAVQMAPPEVRSQFARMFGAQGDSALAAYFLDPTKALPILEQNLAQAQFSGTGERLGFQPTDQQSLAAAQQGISAAQAQSGFAKLDQTAGLYTTQLGDRTTVDRSTGINAQFGLQPGAQQLVDQRLKERVAAFSGNPATPETESTGSSGFGTAGR